MNSLTRDTSSPFSIISFNCLPRSDPEATSALRRSPDERWQNPYFSTMREHCVPLPEPGPPGKFNNTYSFFTFIMIPVKGVNNLHKKNTEDTSLELITVIKDNVHVQVHV